MGEDQAKNVIVVAEDDKTEALHHMKSHLDAISGRQGLWQVAELHLLSLLGGEPRQKETGKKVLEERPATLVILLGRRPPRAFGLGTVPWFALRPRGRHVFVVMPHTKSRWWTRKNNVERARVFLLGVVDHFSVRFGQRPGTVADVAPSYRIERTGRLVVHNESPDRILTCTAEGEPPVRIRPGGKVEIWNAGGEPRVATWEPRLVAPAAKLRVVVYARREPERTYVSVSRGLTAAELDAACPEPVHPSDVATPAAPQAAPQAAIAQAGAA
jgi:hypothetical protein